MSKVKMVRILVPAVSEDGSPLGDMPEQVSVLCANCKRLRGAPTCEPFPGGIPEPILNGDHDHREPFPGDGGLLYLPPG